MRDLVKQLRTHAANLDWTGSETAAREREAAARIEALEAEVQEYMRRHIIAGAEFERMLARIEALEAALREIFAVGDGWGPNTEENPTGTTGEGHAECRKIARAALDPALLRFAGHSRDAGK